MFVGILTVFLPELCGSDPSFQLKCFSEYKRIPISAGQRHSSYRKVCQGKQLCRTGDPVIDQIILRRHIHALPEQPVQITPVNADIIRDIRHFDAVGIVVVDILKRPADIHIFFIRDRRWNNIDILRQYRKKGKIPVQKIESENIEETIAEEIWNGILTSFNAFRQD